MKQFNINKCRYLRRNQTIAENKFWNIVRNRQFCKIKFRRQFPIGRYILDFYIPEYRLEIEIDGGQHYEDVQKEYDNCRTEKVATYGIQIMRFSDLDILNNIKGVCEAISEKIDEIKNSPHLNPLPRGERKNKIKERYANLD